MRSVEDPCGDPTSPQFVVFNARFEADATNFFAWKHNYDTTYYVESIQH